VGDALCSNRLGLWYWVGQFLKKTVFKVDLLGVLPYQSRLLKEHTDAERCKHLRARLLAGATTRALRVI
jgi:hypothetical protein